MSRLPYRVKVKCAAPGLWCWTCPAGHLGGVTTSESRVAQSALAHAQHCDRLDDLNRPYGTTCPNCHGTGIAGSWCPECLGRGWTFTEIDAIRLRRNGGYPA